MLAVALTYCTCSCASKCYFEGMLFLSKCYLKQKKDQIVTWILSWGTGSLSESPLDCMDSSRIFLMPLVKSLSISLKVKCCINKSFSFQVCWRDSHLAQFSEKHISTPFINRLRVCVYNYKLPAPCDHYCSAVSAKPLFNSLFFLPFSSRLVFHMPIRNALSQSIIKSALSSVFLPMFRFSIPYALISWYPNISAHSPPFHVWRFSSN